MADVTDLYLQAQALRAAGERVVSTDEMTGIQALERKHPTIPMGPGRAERREFEYIRRGTSPFAVQKVQKRNFWGACRLFAKIEVSV